MCLLPGAQVMSGHMARETESFVIGGIHFSVTAVAIVYNRPVATAAG